jgi:predicted Rossmann fold nucleotide-binding protein DprA/Smf involved in DNA uptake
MKEVELSVVLLKKLSDGLKALSQGVETFAKKIDELATPSPATPAKTPAAPKAAGGQRAKPAAKSAPAKEKKTAAARAGQRSESALNDVWALISASANGLDTDALMSKTGFNQKKVHNIVYKLKKQGKIKAVSKGIYTRA